MAEELIQLYAIREARQGNAFAPPDTLYREFEAAFEYEETPDQQRAIDETLAGMQSRKPTDRLICGDVGYGKTEVAMRAAFLAVEGRRQAGCRAGANDDSGATASPDFSASVSQSPGTH